MSNNELHDPSFEPNDWSDSQEDDEQPAQGDDTQADQLDDGQPDAVEQLLEGDPVADAELPSFVKELPEAAEKVFLPSPLASITTRPSFTKCLLMPELARAGKWKS